MTETLQKTSDILHQKHLLLTTAESCTGGWVAKLITDLAGSSSIFDRGFVTYSNQAKQEMLGVSHDSLEKNGAVSEAVVIEMAAGALTHSHADIALAISGIAGPGGGTENKPVGTVCFAWISKQGKQAVTTYYLDGNRDEIRREAVRIALEGVITLING